MQPLRTARKLLLPACLSLAACQGHPSGVPGDATSAAVDGAASAEPETSAVFSDETAAAGLDFVHHNGMSGERYIVEMMGSGAALVDFDNDGDLDLFLRQGALLAAEAPTAGSPFPATGPLPPGDRLYRNDLVAGGDGALTFTDISAESGLAGRPDPGTADYGLGVAAGDFDNDGWVDLYCTNFGPNRLWRNRGGDGPGDGRGDGPPPPFFEDVTDRSGTDDPRWSAAAVFADLDRDGWLDLWVGNYIDFTLANHRPCYQPSSAPDYCGPLSYRPQPDRLFRNRGGDGRNDGPRHDGPRRDGPPRVTFEDVTADALLATTYGNTLAVLATDLDDDGWTDLYVANDASENHLWRNRGEGTPEIAFEEEALLRGCAVNGAGEREGSMGIDAGDYDGDGDLDLFISHMATETNTLYVNEGQGIFRDGTLTAGLATPSRPLTGFGTGWLDYDNDGWLDLLVVNGAVLVVEALERAGDPYPLHQTNQLFRNLGRSDGPDVRFAEVSLGELAAQSEVSRGLALGDLDNDGDTDAVIVNNNGRARLWLNRLGQENHWLGLRLLDRDGRRQLTDVRVTVLRPGAPGAPPSPLVRRAHRDGSYASASDPRVVVGLGRSGAVSAVRVRWPDGGEEEFSALEVDAYTSLIRGRGRPVGAPR